MPRKGNLYWPKRSQFRGERARRRRFENRVAEAERKSTRALVLSHGGCLDGVGSAIVTLRALGPDDVGVAYCQPSEVQDALAIIARRPGRGRDLLIADLSLNPNRLDEVVEACRELRKHDWHIQWRDHHHKQWEGLDLAPLRECLDVLEVNDDFTESGASLMQKALAPKDKFAKRLADTVKDRDLWINATPDSETLEFAINQMGTSAFTQHMLEQGPKDPVVSNVIAAAAQAQQDNVGLRTSTLAAQAQFHTASDGRKVAMVYGWLPKNVGLHHMLSLDDVHMAINVRPNGKMSLRSRKETSVCHLVARRFDGGGHPNASGGDVGVRKGSYWWYVLRRGRVGRVDAIAEAAVEVMDQYPAGSGDN